MAELTFAKDRGKDRKPNQKINIAQFIDVKGISAQGNQLSRQKVNQIDLLEPLPFQAPEAIPADELEVVDEVEISVDPHLQQQKTLEETFLPHKMKKCNGRMIYHRVQQILRKDKLLCFSLFFSSAFLFNRATHIPIFKCVSIFCCAKDFKMYIFLFCSVFWIKSFENHFTIIDPSH